MAFRKCNHPPLDHTYNNLFVPCNGCEVVSPTSLTSYDLYWTFWNEFILVRANARAPQPHASDSLTSDGLKPNKTPSKTVRMLSPTRSPYPTQIPRNGYASTPMHQTTFGLASLLKFPAKTFILTMWTNDTNRSLSSRDISQVLNLDGPYWKKKRTQSWLLWNACTAF